MKLIPAFGRKSRQSRKPVDVKQAARYAMKKYKKTFVDLARYDRGETISVSQ